jgi:hypothetical protein
MKLSSAAFFLILLLILAATAIADSPPTFVLSWGSLGSSDGQFEYPRGVAVDADTNVYVVDGGNDRIQKFDKNGTFLTKWGSDGDGPGQFISARDIAIDALGNVYVTDGSRIQKFDSNGGYLTSWGERGVEDGQFGSLRGIDVHPNGNVYAAENNFGDQSTRIQVFSPNGDFLFKWGTSGPGEDDMWGALGLAIDQNGQVFVSEEWDPTGSSSRFVKSRVVKYSSNGAIITYWQLGAWGSFDVRRPNYIAVDYAGNVYVSERSKYRIIKFGNDGGYRTQWGNCLGGNLYEPCLDGHPEGVAVDAFGDIYVANGYAHNIQKFSQGGVQVQPTTWGRVKAIWR